LRSDVLVALAVMLGVGYIVFRESGGGSMSGSAASGGGSMSGSAASGGGSMSGSAASGGVPARHPFTMAPSGGSAGHPFTPKLPVWFIKSVQTPLPKKFEPKIYMRNIEALRGRGL
jgi:hypothetical protein